MVMWDCMTAGLLYYYIVKCKFRMAENSVGDDQNGRG